MKINIKFVVDVGEYLEGQEANLPAELAEQFLESNAAVELGREDTKPRTKTKAKADKADDKDL